MKMVFKKILSLSIWISESFQITIVVIPTIAILIYRVELGSDKVALCGGIMQVIGALYGLLIYIDIRKYFSKPTLFELFKSWIKRFPLSKKNVSFIGINNLWSSTTLNANASPWSSDDPSLPIEERLERIIINQDILRKSQELNNETIAKLNTELNEKIINSESTLSSEINQVSAKLEDIHMEDFLWAFTSLFYILIGTVFSSFADYLV